MFTKKWAGGNSIHLDLCGSFSGVHFPFSMWQLTPLAVANNYLFVDFEVIIECFIISNNQSVIATVTETRAGTSDNDSSTSLVVAVRVLTAAIFLFFCFCAISSTWGKSWKRQTPPGNSTWLKDKFYGSWSSSFYLVKVKQPSHAWRKEKVLVKASWPTTL